MQKDKKITSLMRSISGIRGIVGESLTPLVITEYLNAFVQITKAKRVVVGRDTRPTGTIIQTLVQSVLCAIGVEVIILEITTTPTVEMMVPHCKANAGIIITASHNPIEWNALKFLNKEGIFLNQKEIQNLFRIVDEKKFIWSSYHNFGKVTYFEKANDIHIEKILQLPYINQQQIKNQKLRVAYDAVNGAGYKIIPDILRSLGCIVFEIHTTPNGTFPRGAEPVEKNLQDLQKLVVKEKCNIGFATDPDGDRCALVNEKGQAIGEENTLALAVDFILRNKKTPVVTNLSTSFSNKFLANQYGVDFFQSSVGESHVVELMKAKNSKIGGEGNGGVIFPELHYGRDGVLAVVLILQGMVQYKKSLSQWVQKSIPTFVMQKIQIPLKSNFKEWIMKVQKYFNNATVNLQDGLYLSWDDEWIHIRKSNTEPIIRIYVEAKTQQKVSSLIEKIQSI